MTITIKTCLISLLLSMVVFPLSSAWAGDGHKILFINSYHPGYEWSDGVERGVETTLAGKNVVLHKLYMDTKRKRGAELIKAAAAKAKAEIDKLAPDLVITADDNAAKHVIAPFYKDADIPFVFCGVNWDASRYGFPYSNVTGMEEVSLIVSLVNNLSEYAKGSRIGLLSIDAISNKRNVNHFEKELGRPFDKVHYVKSYEEWMQRFKDLQKEVDLMILENPKGITGWDNDKGRAFIEANIRIPIGTTHVWMAPFAMITIGKVPEEQGEWAAATALSILAGTPASGIPIVKNKKGRLLLNLRLSNPLGIVYKHALVKSAEIIK